MGFTRPAWPILVGRPSAGFRRQNPFLDQHLALVVVILLVSIGGHSCISLPPDSGPVDSNQALLTPRPADISGTARVSETLPTPSAGSAIISSTRPTAGLSADLTPTSNPPCTVPPTVTETSPSYLATAGSRTLDASGRDVRITGVNWSGFETPTISPHGLNQRRWCDLLDQIVALGFNTIRLPFSSQLFDTENTPGGIDFARNPDLADLSSLQIMDRLIAGAGTRNLKVILSHTGSPGPDRSALWYSDVYPEQRWIADWQLLAQRYLGNDTVIGFDLYDEPRDPACWGCGDPTTDWQLAAERVGNAILAVNPNLLIFVAGVESHGEAAYWPGGNLQGVRDHPIHLSIPGRVVYSPHDFGPKDASQPLFDGRGDLQSMVTQWDTMWGYISRLGIAPVLLSGFGGQSVGADPQGIWQRTLVNYLSANRFQYAYWALNPDAGSGLLQEDWQTPERARVRLLQSYQYPQIQRPFLVDTHNLESALHDLCWVTFAPTNHDPNNGIVPDEQSLREDLQVLRSAGFDGLVTYGAEDRVYRLAPELGFKAMIMGIWDLRSMTEITTAITAGQSDFVVGYVVGNEGRDVRYDDRALYAVMDYVRRHTGKPVTTTEQGEDYTDPVLTAMGDWVFPNVHPYWAGLRQPQEAAQWTAARFADMQARARDRMVVFKEVGLPTAGEEGVNEARQAEYYRMLQNTSVGFVYFEAFDQPWKDWAPVEPYWGLFRSDRSPKEVAQDACSQGTDNGSELVADD